MLLAELDVHALGEARDAGGEHRQAALLLAHLKLEGASVVVATGRDRLERPVQDGGLAGEEGFEPSIP